MDSGDYSRRNYLSAIEVARCLGVSVRQVHRMCANGQLHPVISASGQKRFRLTELERLRSGQETDSVIPIRCVDRINELNIKGTVQKVIVGRAQEMREVDDEAVHLIVTSPPYFNAKMYSGRKIEGSLGDIHSVDEWFQEIGKVWKEAYRVLAPGRKAFINIMNLPVRDGAGGFRTLNLAGRTVDLCEKIGFIFRRDIIWSKTNSVRAHFGSYPYPGGILINNAHEFILEFEKPGGREGKYSHLTREQREMSRLSREFWVELKKSDVWVIAPQGSGDRRSHVAPFPEELPRRLVKAFSFVGETVLDPFAGSGTTLRAAASLGRNGIGYEIVDEIAWEALNSLRLM